jgi:hypothetical protein
MNKEKKGFEREIDKLPEAIAPLALTWQRGTSMEVSWRIDSQDLQEMNENQRTLQQKSSERPDLSTSGVWRQVIGGIY